MASECGQFLSDRLSAAVASRSQRDVADAVGVGVETDAGCAGRWSNGAVEALSS